MSDEPEPAALVARRAAAEAYDAACHARALVPQRALLECLAPDAEGDAARQRAAGR